VRASPPRRVLREDASRQSSALKLHQTSGLCCPHGVEPAVAFASRTGDRAQFRVRWAAHHVRIHTAGVKLIHHPVVGDLELAFESFPLAADPSQSLLAYTAEPGSPSQDALSLLASWAASAHDSHASTHQDDQQERQENRQHDPGHDLRSGSATRPDA
jgi:hypothetical protein